MSKFELIPALITPFTENNLIDFEALKQLALRLIEEGADGFVVLGTTGEAASLTLDERMMIIRFLRDLIPQTKSMIVGVGTNNLEETIRNIQMAKELGADAVLVVTPYYVCPNQEGLRAYFDAICKVCPLPIYLYNVKRRCGVELSPDSVEYLRKKHGDKIVGLKQACGNYLEYLYLKLLFPYFRLFSGDDNLMIEAKDLGLNGIITVVGNVKLTMMKAVLEEKKTKQEWEKLCEYLYKEPTPAPTKYIASKQGIGTERVRLPLVSISDNLRKELEQNI